MLRRIPLCKKKKKKRTVAIKEPISRFIKSISRGEPSAPRDDASKIERWRKQFRKEQPDSWGEFTGGIYMVSMVKVNTCARYTGHASRCTRSKTTQLETRAAASTNVDSKLYLTLFMLQISSRLICFCFLFDDIHCCAYLKIHRKKHEARSIVVFLDNNRFCTEGKLDGIECLVGKIGAQKFPG